MGLNVIIHTKMSNEIFSSFFSLSLILWFTVTSHQSGSLNTRMCIKMSLIASIGLRENPSDILHWWWAIDRQKLDVQWLNSPNAYTITTTKSTYSPAIIHLTTSTHNPSTERESLVQSAKLAATIIILDCVQRKNRSYLIHTFNFNNVFSNSFV